jgi:hypothetical protein
LVPPPGEPSVTQNSSDLSSSSVALRDRLVLKQRELGEAFVKGTYRIEHDQMRMLADLLTREFTMTKADLEKDQRDAAVLQKEIDSASDDSLILGLRSSIANNKPRPGAVTVVIDLTLQDIIVDYNLRQAAKKKQEHFSTEGMRHLLAAA